MNNNEIMLSKEDYLAISTEYQAEKKAISKKYRKIMIVGLIIMGFGALVLPFIFYDPSSIFIPLIVIIVGSIICGVGVFALERIPKELGIKYYQRYVAEYNAKHRQ